MGYVNLFRGGCGQAIQSRTVFGNTEAGVNAFDLTTIALGTWIDTRFNATGNASYFQSINGPGTPLFARCQMVIPSMCSFQFLMLAVNNGQIVAGCTSTLGPACTVIDLPIPPVANTTWYFAAVGLANVQPHPWTMPDIDTFAVDLWNSGGVSGCYPYGVGVDGTGGEGGIPVAYGPDWDPTAICGLGDFFNGDP